MELSYPPVPPVASAIARQYVPASGPIEPLAWSSPQRLRQFIKPRQEEGRAPARTKIRDAEDFFIPEMSAYIERAAGRHGTITNSHWSNPLSTGIVSHNVGIMSEPLTRPELDAKLETIEVKMDGRISRIEEVAGDIKEALRTTQGDIQSLKKTVIVTAISTTVTIVLGVAAFNASLTSNMVAALGSGKDIGAALEQVRTQSMESERRAAQAAEQAKLAQAATTEALAEIKKVVDDIRATRLQDLQQ